MVLGICVIIIMVLLFVTMVVYVITHEDPTQFPITKWDDEEQERFLREWSAKHKNRKEPFWKRKFGGRKK